MRACACPRVRVGTKPAAALQQVLQQAVSRAVAGSMEAQQVPQSLGAVRFTAVAAPGAARPCMRACRAAMQYGTLKPYCIFDGNTSSIIYRWLVEQNVTMIKHVPAWRDDLIRIASLKMKVRAAPRLLPINCSAKWVGAAGAGA